MWRAEWVAGGVGQLCKRLRRRSREAAQAAEERAAHLARPMSASLQLPSESSSTFLGLSCSHKQASEQVSVCPGLGPGAGAEEAWWELQQQG